MRKTLRLSLSKQEANLIMMWAIRDAKLPTASLACSNFDDRIISKIKKLYDFSSGRVK